MKNILITGLNSYIGCQLSKWLESSPRQYLVHKISLRNDNWMDMSFAKYDVIIHVAAIVHIKETVFNQKLYYDVNRDLAYEIAKKAKKEGVKQFIFLSTMSVYGIKNGIINENTPINPISNYGKSKLEGEKLISSICSNSFRTVIVRPPMVYGKGCRGNYTKLSNFALKTPVFPDISNMRSMIYIDNLSEFIKAIIDEYKNGVFFPQNSEYVNTSELVRVIAEIHGKKILMIKNLNWIIRILNINKFNKIFGDLVYDKKMSNSSVSCSFCDFRKSILLTERNDN